ncbi:MAG: tyrosine-type recombinase/integrase [Campylobacteraceae bacterium]|nr:tyrosine-type recombinase/integrase [Campylobacteraceae bacterium]
MRDRPDIYLKRLKPKDKEYFERLSNNLYIRVYPTGSKKFYYLYRNSDNKQRKIAIGNYGEVTLADARQKVTELNALRENGIDDIKTHLDSEASLAKEEFSNTFEKIYNEFADKRWKINEKGIISIETASRNRREIKKWVLDKIGNKPISSIEKRDISTLLVKRAESSPEWAHRLHGLLNQIFRYALSLDYIDRNVVSDIEMNNIVKKPEVINFQAITTEPYFTNLCKAIYENNNITTKNILKFMLHIPLRSKNAVSLKWDYVDFDEKLLTIPRDEMKVNNANISDFILPLSDEVVKILKNQEKLCKDLGLFGDYVFPRFRTSSLEPIAANTINRELERMGFNEGPNYQRTHSFRKTYSTIIKNEKASKFSFEARELFLDHRVGNQVSLAYSGGATMLKELEEIASWWSSFILERVQK